MRRTGCVWVASGARATHIAAPRPRRFADLHLAIRPGGDAALLLGVLHVLEGVALRVAGDHGGASLNDLTDETHLDVLSGNAAFTGVPVTVEAERRSAAGS